VIQRLAARKAKVIEVALERLQGYQTLSISCMFVTLETFHDEMSSLNDDALSNISTMLVTLETFHNEISPLNADAS
jgi:hypothetical protein